MRIAFRLILLALTMAFAGAADALGNMRVRTEGANSVSTMNYADGTNRVSSATIIGQNRTFSYDARGNVANNGNYSFVYDLLNQPVSQAGAVNATFAYDGNLKRVKEVRGGKTIYTVYSRATGGLIYRDQATDVVKTDYVSVGGAALRLKKIGTGPLVPEYTHFDLQGSAVAATDAAGAVLWRESYRPYGRSRLDPPANDNNTGYTGHLADKSTGLVYMQARYYDPLIGRFLSTDPIGYQDQLNLYAYVANDPVNATDPNGEFIVLLANPLVRGAIGGALGAVAGAAANAGAQYLRTGSVNVGDALAAGAATGAASAAIAANPALAANPAALSAIGAAAGISGSVGGDVVNGRDINVANAAVAGVAGAVGVPGGAKVGDLVENALGATAGSVAGETAGAIGGEAVAGAINAAIPGVANAVGQAGSAAADGARAAGGAIQRGVQELQNMNQGPSCAQEENGC